MKTRTILCFVFFLIAINGCEKNNLNNDSLNILKNELNNMANSAVDPKLIFTPCNLNNVYDAWGETFFLSVTKVLYEIPKSDLSDIDFKNKLIDAIPNEFLQMDTTGVNLKKVNLVFKEFLSLFIKRNIYEALQISVKMEQHVNQTWFLSNPDKVYLLKMVSILRYSTYLSFSRNTKSTDGSFERCWIRKLQEMDDKGFFEKLACVTAWPTCFAAMLADCGIEELKAHVFN